MDATGQSLDELVDTAKRLTYMNDVEHSVFRMKDGTLQMFSGGRDGIKIGSIIDEIKTWVGHTHPYSLPPTGPSPGDFAVLDRLGQKSSWLLEHGEFTKFWRKP